MPGVILCVFVLFSSWAMGAAPSTLEQAVSRLQGKLVTFCADSSGWPPFTYPDREEERGVSGLTPELIQKVFAPHKLEVDIRLMPWGKCLKQVREGKVMAALDASSSRQRREAYLLSDPYFYLKPAFFYNRMLTSELADNVAVDELMSLGKICGIRHYNYENHGLTNSQIQRHAKDLPSLYLQTLGGQCEGFLARYEVVSAFEQHGVKMLSNPLIGMANIQDVEPESFHCLISKSLSERDALKRILNQGFASTQAIAWVKQRLLARREAKVSVSGRTALP